MLRFTFIALFSLFCVACQHSVDDIPANEYTVKEIPNTIINQAELKFDKQTSLWYHDDELFSGYIVTKYDNDSLMRKMSILNGKKEGASIDWYPNGKKRSVTNFKNGKLHGKKLVWNQNKEHTLLAELNFQNGKAEGEQKKWYPSGELYQILQMKDGHEEGIQQAFRKNGDLYANYEAKNGRIFGMKKAALCFGLENQKIKNEE